ncbi:MAG TPA: hypothetical protein VKG25_11160 [Bryobacteraceae bacterium]|nr:hypothetical protein [Bryobacteraceae bacterium]
MTQSVVRFAIFVGLVPAFAQLDAYKLREKYGLPKRGALQYVGLLTAPFW